MLFFIEQAFRRYQLENFDALINRPAVRRDDLAQLLLRLRESYVEALLPRLGPFENKLQSQSGLPGARVAFGQKQSTPRQPAIENVIQPRDPGSCLGNRGCAAIHRGPRC